MIFRTLHSAHILHFVFLARRPDSNIKSGKIVLNSRTGILYYKVLLVEQTDRKLPVFRRDLIIVGVKFLHGFMFLLPVCRLSNHYVFRLLQQRILFIFRRLRNECRIHIHPEKIYNLQTANKVGTCKQTKHKLSCHLRQIYPIQCWLC